MRAGLLQDACFAQNFLDHVNALDVANVVGVYCALPPSTQTPLLVVSGLVAAHVRLLHLLEEKPRFEDRVVFDQLLDLVPVFEELLAGLVEWIEDQFVFHDFAGLDVVELHDSAYAGCRRVSRGEVGCKPIYKLLPLRPQN